MVGAPASAKEASVATLFDFASRYRRKGSHSMKKGPVASRYAQAATLALRRRGFGYGVPARLRGISQRYQKRWSSK